MRQLSTKQKVVSTIAIITAVVVMMAMLASCKEATQDNSQSQHGEITNNATTVATVKPTDGNTTTTMSKTTGTTTRTASKTNPASKALSKKEALNIAKDLVMRYENFCNVGLVCDIDFDVNCSSEEYEKIESLLTKEEQDCLGILFGKCTCCKSIDEAKKHLQKCLDPSILYEPDMCVQYKGNLYIFGGAKGGITYENVAVKSYNNDKIIAYADLFGSGGDYGESSLFTIVKRSGNYVIANVSEYKERIPAVGKDTISITLNWIDKSVYLDFRVSGKLDSGKNTEWKGEALFDENNNIIAKIDYSGSQGRTLTIFNNKARYSIMVEDPNYAQKGINDIVGAGATITIRKGTSIISKSELPLYQSYTGAWFGGVCEIDHGKILNYDASWLNIE